MNFLQKPHLNKAAFHCIFILVVYTILLLIRVPILVNADLFLSTDEGFMAVDMAELFRGGPFYFYHENVSYQGIFHSLMAIPFFWLFGVSSFTFKLPAVLYYTLYIWTFFLLAIRLNRKIAWVSVALLILCPPNILELTTYNYPHTLSACFGNAAFLIFLSHRDNPSYLKVFYITFIIGFSLYVYTFSAIYFAVIIILWALDAQISFRDVFERLKPACLREGCARLIDITILLNLFWVLITYMTGGISSKIGDFYLFNSFIRNNTPHYWMSDSSQAYIPFIEFFIFIVTLRILIFRTDIIHFFKTAKYSPSMSFLVVGLFGFLMGLIPRWIGLYRNSISGHPGYELDLGLHQMWHKLSDLVFVQLPKTLELNSYLGMLVAVLVGVAIFNTLHRDKSLVKMIFAILSILILSVLIIYQKPNAVRHIFPLYGVIVFYAALFLFNVEKKSIHSFWILLIFWGSFYSYASYDYYKKSNIINGFSSIERDTPSHDLIRYAREKQFDVVYTDYSAHKLQFLSSGNPNFVEFYSNPYRGWKRLIKTRDYINFAVLIPEGKNSLVYETHLKEKKIVCDREKVKKYLVLSQCQSPSQVFSDLRELNQLRSLAQR